jgi:hypothetical protein
MARAPQSVEAPRKSVIGRRGELLVQYELLRYGIESAPMTTDTGVDLVAYAPKSHRALTIQVKSNDKPHKAGGKGNWLQGWSLRKSSPAEYVALVDLDQERIWVLTHEQFCSEAQQKNRPEMTLYAYLKPLKKRASKTIADLNGYSIDRWAQTVGCL